jgi:hypothetical protein
MTVGPCHRSGARFSPAEFQVQSLVTSRKIHGGLNGTETGFPSRFFGFSLIIIILPLLYTQLSSPPPEVFDIPDQAAQYHLLGLWFFAGSALGWLQSKKLSSISFQLHNVYETTVIDEGVRIQEVAVVYLNALSQNVTLKTEKIHEEQQTEHPATWLPSSSSSNSRIVCYMLISIFSSSSLSLWV